MSSLLPINVVLFFQPFELILVGGVNGPSGHRCHFHPDGRGFVAEQERDATISRKPEAGFLNGGWLYVYVTRIIRSSGIVTSSSVYSLGHHDIIKVPKFSIQLGTRCVHIEDV
jgi:hypothetical protein